MDEREVHELLRGAAETVQPTPDLSDRAERRFRSRRARGRMLATAVVVVLIGSGIATAAALSGDRSRPHVARPIPTPLEREPIDPNAFNSLAFVDATTGYAVETSGTDAVLAKTDDGGSIWRAVARMPAETRSVALASLRHAPVQLVAWGKGDLYETSDDGAHWNRIFQHVENVAVSPGRIWATARCDASEGESCVDKVMVSDDDGSSWIGVLQFRSIGAVAASSRLLDVAFALELPDKKSTRWEIARAKVGTLWTQAPTPCPAASAEPLLALGTDGVSLMLVCKFDARDRVFVSANEGRTWTETVALPDAAGHVRELAPLDNSPSTFVVGLGGWTKGPLIGLVLDQWALDSLPQPFGEVRAIDVVPGAGVFFAASRSGVWFRSEDGTWERRTPLTTTPAISGPVDVAAIGSLTFIDANEGYGVESQRYLVHTADGGRTWRRAGLMPEGARSLMFAPAYAESVTHLVAWGDGSLSESTDGGAHWQSTLGPSVYAVSEASFRLWATVACGPGAPSPCTPRLATSTDGGVTWRDPDASPELRAPGAQAITSPSGSSVYLVDGELILTNDGGRSWTRRPQPAECESRPIPHVAIFVETLLLVCGPSPQLGTGLRAFVSPDEARTWRPTALFPADNRAGSATVSASDNGLLAAAGSGPLRFTTDGGASWHDAFPMPATGSIVALSQAYGVGVWAAAGDQGIWFSVDGTHWEQRAES